MERQGPAVVATVMVTHLRWFDRLWRGGKRGLIVTGVLLIVGNLALLMVPAPHVHICLFPLAFALGPIVAAFGLKDRVLVSAGELPCPKCQKPVEIPDGLGGWPVRFNCNSCAAMVELDELRAE